ncbi:MAG TPA: response regulator [Nanoarchaeota archaeon]|nr:response regulator [Nanoarchaeota archaeon]
MKKILVLDDHEKWHILAERDIAYIADCSIDHAYSLNQAMDLLKTGSYSLIVSDINLNMGSSGSQEGLYFIKYIRESGSKTPIICVSSGKCLESIVLQAGADKFVAKSEFYPEFIKAVEGYLK